MTETIAVDLEVWRRSKIDALSDEQIINAIDDFVLVNTLIIKDYDLYYFKSIKAATVDRHSKKRYYPTIRLEIECELRQEKYSKERQDFINYNKGYESIEKLGKEFDRSAISELSARIINELRLLVVASNIARPGAIKIKSGGTYHNGELIDEIGSIYNPIRHDLKYINKDGWIRFRDLELNQVLNWILEKRYDFENYSKNKTHTAFNAFSHLHVLYGEDSILGLIWSLIGIEALYCSGGPGVTNQIFERTQLVLGNREGYKQKLKDMYNIRSRLLHGQLGVSYAGSVIYEKNDKEIYDSTWLATAILTASFQVMIFKDIDKLEFELTLKQ